MPVRILKPKYDVLDTKGTWKRVRGGKVTKGGVLYFKQPDGTTGFRSKPQWRPVITVSW